MKKFVIFFLITVFGCSGYAQNTSDMLETVLSSVVTVAVYKVESTRQILGFRGNSDIAYDQALDLSNSVASGSGFIIEKGGKKYVITNAHVVEDASTDKGSIYVYSINRSKYEVAILGGDSFYDIAVLTFIDTPAAEVSALPIRTTEARIGETVYAIGNPLGEYPYTISDGIISARNRVRGGATGKFGFLQTTATVIWGNSGGPLVDTKGELVGINSQIAFAQANDMLLWQPQINFALEGLLSNRLIDEIINNDGRVKRAFIGIEVSQRYETVFDRVTSTDQWQLKDMEPVISGVMRSSPAFSVLADKLGARLLEVNGAVVRNIQEVLGEFEKAKPGETVSLLIFHDNAEEKVEIKTQELNARHHEQIARYVMEKEDRVSIVFDDNKVLLNIGKEYANKKVQSKKISTQEDSYQVLTVGLSEEDYDVLWRLNSLSDLGAALRFTGPYGFYDMVVVDQKKPRAKPEKIRISLADSENLQKLTLWY
ncbi:MAG TPA: trypsin-like peptidase domain-containing protein [Bacteroidales bacterium]|nr:trypsin-like peptidase domain-containing protein [Bacteroidales bacterium]HOH84437.1 trypsin-like peptidase domain-containing protein [Bacteroidales bacterium]